MMIMAQDPRQKGSTPDWDARYAAAEAGLFGEAPNDYVRAVASRPDFAARTALCLADGDGRNSTWLAGQGLAVTALDLSPVAVDKAQARDAAAGHRVSRTVADLADWAPPAAVSWDAAFLIYLQCEEAVRLRAIEIAGAALAPGGWFVLEAFAKPSSTPTGLGPDDAALLYSIAELEASLPGFDIVEALEGRVRLEEGERHTGIAEVVRFAARKPK